jgi:hypothetical protein
MMRILALAPVNKQAAIITSQSGCEDDRGYLTRDELCKLIDVTRRRRDEIGASFVFYSKKHKTNFCNDLRHGRLDRRVTTDMPAALEYARLGAEVQRLEKDLQHWREIRRMGHAIEVWGKDKCTAA